MILVDGTNPTIASVQCFILALATLDRISSGTFAFALEGRKKCSSKDLKSMFSTERRDQREVAMASIFHRCLAAKQKQFGPNKSE
jgi:hypothetical protein